MPSHKPDGTIPRGGLNDASVVIEIEDAAVLGAPESFPLTIEVTGWEKKIPIPHFGDDMFVFAAPNLKVTLTNGETGETYTTSITGATHREVQPDGTIVETYTGRHLNGDPVLGLVFISGHFTATYEANGNEPGDLIEPLSGTGNITPFWEFLL